MENNVEKRKAFFENIADFWHDLGGEEYALFDNKEITEEEHEEIKKAAQAIYKIYHKTNKLLRKMDDETLLELGYPKETLKYLRYKTIVPETIISRLDMFKGLDGNYKHYEINADTPTFIKELFSVSNLLSKEFGRKSPNEKEEEWLKEAIKDAVLDSYTADGSKEDLPNLFFVSHKENEEDWYTTKYLSDICELPNQLIDYSELVINDDGLYTTNGVRVDVLYRQTYPIEYFIEDTDETGETKVGLKMLDLVVENKLCIINPISAFLMQNKGVQALIWTLHEEQSLYFDSEEHEMIEKHFIPSYFEKEGLEHKKFVKKPIYGREGDTIEIFNENGEKIQEDEHKSYQHFNSIYQEFMPLPKENVVVGGEIKERHILYGVFVINGKVSAIGCRAGNQITGNESEFLSLGYKKP